MPLTTIPVDLLRRSPKILFVAHLALGDFAYLQNSLRALSLAYPHLSIHIWVDELRRTDEASQWSYLQKYVLYDWLRECAWIEKIYDETYSPELLRQSIVRAQAEAYPIVVSLGLLNRPAYARLARSIAPDGFVVGQIKSVNFMDIRAYLAYRRLDAVIPAYPKRPKEPRHISAIYAGWFEQLFSIQIPADQRFPFVNIPEKWRSYATSQFAEWHIHDSEKTIFLNGFSKAKERSWSLSRVIELVQKIRNIAGWEGAHFIVNAVPESLVEARQLIESQGLQRVHLFSAEENFFQLPAILAQCDLIISVETAVMHLANAVHVPVIALMRQTNPEWAPIDVANSIVLKTVTSKGHIDEISSADVVSVFRTWLPAVGLASSADQTQA